MELRYKDGRPMRKYNSPKLQAIEMENKQTAVEWLIEQLRQLAHNPSTHLGMGDIRVTQGMIDEFEEQAKQMEREQTEISDEEIEKAIIDQDVVKQEGYCHCFLEGAKWYREQLKKKYNSEKVNSVPYNLQNEAK